MPRKKIQLPLCPVDFSCLNCDQPMTLTRYIKLFCSDACRDEAKLVRYIRSCGRDGRINQPDIQDAISIRFAHALSGGYRAKERRLSAAKRRAVFERDNGLCRKCGQPGTDVDHVDGSSNDLANLQLLCKACHNEKTRSKFVPLTPEHERYAEIEAKRESLLFRAKTLAPQRACDDDENWYTINREVMSERRRIVCAERARCLTRIRGDKKMVEEVSITQELNELGKLKEQREALKQEEQARIEQVLTPEIMARVEEIEDEFATRAEAIGEEIAALEARVKARVIQYGETVRGTSWQAVWSRGQVRWDTKSIDKYAESHPEILDFRKEGPPTVSIRKIQRKPDAEVPDDGEEL